MNWPSVVVGFVLGLLGDWIRAWRTRHHELWLAKQELYTELAEYVAWLERAFEPGNDIKMADYSKVRSKRPTFIIYDWYKANRLDILMEVDKKRGLRALYTRWLDPTLNPDPRSIRGPDSLKQDVEEHRSLLDTKLLDKQVSKAKARLAHGINTGVL